MRTTTVRVISQRIMCAFSLTIMLCIFVKFCIIETQPPQERIATLFLWDVILKYENSSALEINSVLSTCLNYSIFSLSLPKFPEQAYLHRFLTLPPVWALFPAKKNDHLNYKLYSSTHLRQGFCRIGQFIRLCQSSQIKEVFCIHWTGNIYIKL